MSSLNRMSRLQAMCVCAFLTTSCTYPSALGRGDRSAAVEHSAASPRFSQGGPDAEEYGASEGYPIGDRGTCSRTVFLVGCHSHLDQVYEARLVRRATMASPLARAAVEPTIRYDYQGQTFTFDDYLARNPATGLLIARGDTILIERYQYAQHDRHRLTSWSMAKTVTAMLIGIAIAEGRIRSVDDLAAAYVPALVGTEYGRTSLRHMLQMSSGVRFIEEYSGNDDIARLSADTFRQVGPGGVQAVKPFNIRIAPAGSKFYYASAETQVLGLVLRSAVGRPARRIPAGKDLGANRGGSRCDLAYRPLWAKRLRIAASTRYCATTDVWAYCSPMAGTGAGDRSFPRLGSTTPRVYTQINRSPVQAAMGIRSGYYRVSGGCLCFAAFVARRSTSILPADS